VFYFGSQTGTAEKFVSQLDEDANFLDLKTQIVDFNDFTEESFPEHKLVICVIATHYEGDPCDNTKKMHKWIK
jgi:sulfite reductase alpha subunit-like flavoprotein